MKTYEEISIHFPADKEDFFLQQMIHVRKKYYKQATESYNIVKDILVSNEQIVCYHFQMIFDSEENYLDYLANEETKLLSQELERFCGPALETKRSFQFDGY